MGGELPSSGHSSSHSQCALVIAVHLVVSYLVSYFLYLSRLYVCETSPVSSAHSNLTFMEP